MLDAEFSVTGFWIGAGLLLFAVIVVTIGLARWVRGAPERSSQLSVFAMGFVAGPVVGVLGIKLYFPFFYWLAAQLSMF